ncbi:MAG: hypothetical protein PHP00_01860 [Thiotrichaceae bacterium]|nr:hypothetical protein [Thiotrichaceae bacterium]
MTDEELKALVASLAIAQQETNRFIKELVIQSQETDRQLKELGIQIEDIGNKFGSFAEGMAFPALEKILRKQFGLDVVSTNTKSQKGGRELELDALGYSTGDSNTVVIVEMKSHLNEKDIEQVLKMLDEFPFFFPELAHKKRYGMIASIVASKDIKQKVAEAGLYLGIVQDEQFKLSKPKGFKPRCFTEK